MWPWLQFISRGLITGLVMLSLMVAEAPAVLASALDDVRAGNEFFKAGRLDEAVDAYTQAITSGELQSETLAITYNNRGVALGERDDFDRAIDDYEKALQLLPADPTTAKNLRVAFIKRGMGMQAEELMAEAAADFDRAIAAEPDHYLGYLRRAELNVLRGSLALAVSDYKLALARKPGDSELISALNQARNALSEPVDRQIVSDEVPTQSPDTAPAVTPTAETETGNPVVPPARVEELQPSEPSSDTATQTPATTTAESESSEVAPAAIEPSAGREFMVTIGAVNVRSAPANSGDLVTTVGEGVVLPVLGEELGWKRVELSDGGIGYIYQRWLKPVAAQ